MREILVIAKLTWTELLRDRFVALLGFVAFLLLILSNFLGSLTLDEQKRLLVHLGFASFQLTLVGLGLFLGSWSLQKELDRQTCLLVLSRPVSRAQFIIGKWLGAAIMISLFWLLCGLLHLMLLGFSVSVENFAITHFTLWVEALFILSLAFLFASFLRPLLALASALTVWLAGHWREDLVFFAKKSGSPVMLGLSSLSGWAFPPLNLLEVRTLAFIEQGQSLQLIWPILNLFFWCALCLFGAQLIWRRRDLV